MPVVDLSSEVSRSIQPARRHGRLQFFQGPARRQATRDSASGGRYGRRLQVWDESKPQSAPIQPPLV